MKIRAEVEFNVDYVSDLTNNFDNVTILEIDGKEYFGSCVSCFSPLVKGNYFLDLGDDLICGDCGGKKKHQLIQRL